MDNMTNDDIEISKLESVLKENADYTASESQAIACGMLVVNIAADKLQWLRLLLGEVDMQDSSRHEAIRMLGQLFDETRQQLQDSNLEFKLLLPDDEAPLEQRVNTLQEWCQGFLLGLALSGVKDHKVLPEDSRELLTDFVEIGGAGDFDLQNEDESEEALSEIVEYIRMGVLLINEELQPIKQSSVLH